MIQVYVPQDKPVSVGGQISPGAAAAPGESAAAFGRAIQSQGMEFFDKAKKAYQTAAYTKAYSEAMSALNVRTNERYNSRTDKDGNPNFQSLPDDIVKIGNDTLEEFAKGIPDDEVAQQFRSSFSNTVLNHQAKAMSESRRQAIEFSREEIFKGLDTLTQAAAAGDEFDVDINMSQAKQILDSAVANGSIDPTDREKLSERFRSTVSGAQATKAINADPRAAMVVLQDAELSKELGLNELERMQYLGRAEDAVNRMERAEAAQVKVAQKEVNDLIKGVDQVIEAGVEPDPDMMNTLIQTANTAGMQNEVGALLKKKSLLSGFGKLNEVERNQVISEFAGEANTPAKQEFLKSLTRVNSNINDAMKGDVVSYAMRQGMIETKPLDFNGSLALQLAERTKVIDTVEANYGRETSGLTSPELDALRERVQGAPTVQERAKLLGEIVNGMGDKSLNVFSDLAQKGAMHLALAGSLIHEGNPEGARLLLTGKDLVANKQYTLPSNELFIGEENDLLPSYLDPAHRGEVSKAVRQVYAAMAAEEGHFDPSVVNTDILEKAVQTVTNGTPLEINGSRIEPPVNGMKEKEFERWMDRLTDKDIQAMGGLKHFSSSIAGQADEVRDMIPVSAGRGRYFLFKEVGGMFSKQRVPVLNEAGTPFVLDYNFSKQSKFSRPSPIKSEGQEEYLNKVRSQLDLTGISSVDEMIGKITVPVPMRATPEVVSAIEEASSMANIEANVMAKIVGAESNWNPNARNPFPGQTAGGLFQFIDSTWEKMKGIVKKEFGMTLTNKFDPKQNAVAGAALLRENQKYLQSSVGRVPTNGELYAAHVLGAPTAAKLMKADPSLPVSKLLSQAIITVNPALFRPGGRSITVAEALKIMDKKVS